MPNNLKIDPHQHQDEGLFIQSFKAGDADAFECIYRQMYQPLTCSAKTIIDSDVDAEDITAGAFLKLYTHGRKDIKSLEHIKRWMFVVVRNDSINFLRRRSKENAIQRDLAHNQHMRHDLHAEKSDTALEHLAIHELEKLPRQAKAVLHLYYFGRKNTRQIADILQISGQTVLNHKTKALQSLRRRISGQPHSQ